MQLFRSKRNKIIIVSVSNLSYVHLLFIMKFSRVSIIIGLVGLLNALHACTLSIQCVSHGMQCRFSANLIIILNMADFKAKRNYSWLENCNENSMVTLTKTKYDNTIKEITNQRAKHVWFIDPQIEVMCSMIN